VQGVVSPYFVLTNRKRTVVALAHTVVFLMLAVRGAFTVVKPLHRSSPVTAWVMPAVYLVVSAVLLVLAAMAKSSRERLYFACCTVSAGFGFFRQCLGDPRMHPAGYVRVVMLLSALLVGLTILRQHSRDSAGLRTATP
jgi:lysylphosphatidylglycerol synthetase-like protein (DUF2156 family)